jgi:1-acyl-sn-glycerol-3-phosphate acyltransferase
MNRFFLKVYRYLNAHPFLLWGSLSILILLCIISASRLRFVEDVGSFFPNKGDNRRINYAYQHLGSANRIVVNIKELKNPSEPDEMHLEEAADTFVTRLQRSGSQDRIKSVLYQIDPLQISSVTDFVISNLPLYMEEQDYARMDSLLSKDKIDKQLMNDRNLLSAPVSMVRTMVQSDPMFFSSRILHNLEGFSLSDQYQTIDDYIFNKEGTEAIVIVTSKYPVSETRENAKLIDDIDAAASHTGQDLGVKVVPFGASMVSITNATQIKKDSAWAVALSLILIVALLIYYYRNFTSILMIVVSILFGGLLAAGVIPLIKNPVSVIAIGLASVIFGIAINYPIHFLSGLKRTSNKEQIIKDIVNPLLTGNITTVGAFLSLVFISSDAMKDLGLFAALLLVGTILFVLIYLPHFKMKGAVPSKTNELAFKRVAEFSPESKGSLVLLLTLITIAFYFFSPKTSFETDMHSINYMTKEQKEMFAKLTAESDTTVQPLYVVSEAKTMDEALQYHEQALSKIEDLKSTGAIAKISGIGHFIPSSKTQKEHIEAWNAFWLKHKEGFEPDFDEAASKAGFKIEAFAPFKAMLNTPVKVQPASHFAAIDSTLAQSYIVQDKDKVLVYDILEVSKSRFQNVQNAFSDLDSHIYTFADSSIASRMADALSGDFNYVLYICGFIVFAFILLSFGRLEITLLAFLPLAIAWIWILSIMGLAGLKFNIVNIILATFIFGQGDDFSIFVTEGVMYEYRTGRKMLSQFKNSIILSSSIMFIAIGMLVFAKHPALRSLAEVTIIGMFTVVSMAYVFPPFLFKLLTKKNGKPRLMPSTLKNFLKTVYVFTVFLIGSILITLIGFFLLTLGGKTSRHKLIFHKIMSGTFKFFSKVMPEVDCKVENASEEDFSRPAIITCNHQSHLDLLYTLMLSPKIVALTNHWVWNCPFYGWIIRYCDFLPVEDNIEENIPRLKELVEKGYSILVFPEGTRSEDCSILRFHQGAFFLADKLGLDIVPVVIYGIGHFFPKTEFLLRKGSVTVKILDRITPESELRKGLLPRQVASSVKQLYENEYEGIASIAETADYYRNLVISNYIYKGAIVERTCRKSLKDMDAVRKFIDSLPDGGKVLMRHCGQGELALISALVKKKVDFTACEPDPDKLEIAAHCASVPSNLHYCPSKEGGNWDLDIDLNNVCNYE